ncbi:phage tail tape measure protein [Microbacterium sp. 11MF]|uniref:phage tail tape measure protein n=1 Tax=Microbacterium sp. 11MF TaxID=1169146 RepID=UPI0003733601|nr:phage tail tape measure protein [Microbacterium sp. 11MF]
MRVAELEVLFTADDKPLEAAGKRADATVKRLNSQKIQLDADDTAAIAGMERVETRAKQLVSKDTALRVNANIDEAQKSVDTIEKELDYLRSLSTNVQVDADVQRAENKLRGARRALNALEGARAEMVVDVDDDPAKQKLSSVEDYAGDAGDDAGAELGENLISALVAIPIAGAVIGVGAAVGKALIDGARKAIGQEAGRDRLAALTGLDEADAGRLARAAGEAYANVFGESVESNMDTARLALQFGILDADASNRDAQKVIEGLAGIADVLGEDVKPVATAVSTLLSTGVAKSAEEAFDLIAAGERNGANRADDLLDTLTEYPALFSRLGLEGDEALGLINQALEGGARNSDLAADALKEFQIRATDGSKTSATAFGELGLSADEMTAKIAKGGESARDGLALVLDKLRETEDPVLRNAAAVGLFGTQAEDLGDALFKMDLSNAVEQLDGVTGSAQRMFDTLADNDATKLEQAQRNIEVAMNGIQGALAAAFSEPLGDVAEFVSQNRGPVLEFLLQMANGALDFGESMVIAVADGTEAFGGFVAGPLADTVEGIAGIIDVMNGFGERPKELDDLAESMRGFDSTTADAADQIRENLLPGIDDARDRLNGFGDSAVAMGYLNDASLRLADAIANVGDESGDLETQTKKAVAALNDEITAAEDAGESQDALSDRFRVGTDAIRDQMVQSDLTKNEAQKLIDTILATPSSKGTTFSSNASDEEQKVADLASRVERLPNGDVVIRASTGDAQRSIDNLIIRNSGRQIVIGSRVATTQAMGGVVDFYASGGFHNLTPMQPVAQMVPASTWRVVGDRSDVPEAFIPLDGSARSMGILAETMRRMGVPAPAGPTVDSGRGASVQVIDHGTYYAYDPHKVAAEKEEKLRRALDAAGLS